MKKHLLTIAALIAIFGLSGCGKILSEGVSPAGNKYHLSKNYSGNSYRVTFTDSSLSRIGAGTGSYGTTVKQDEATLKRNLYVAALETKKMGYNYFVITNSNVNNLNGFPINDADQLARFMTLKKRKPTFATNASARNPDSLVNSGHISIQFKPVPASMKNNGLVSVWSVEKVLRDTKGY